MPVSQPGSGELKTLCPFGPGKGSSFQRLRNGKINRLGAKILSGVLVVTLFMGT